MTEAVKFLQAMLAKSIFFMPSIYICATSVLHLLASHCLQCLDEPPFVSRNRLELAVPTAIGFRSSTESIKALEGFVLPIHPGKREGRKKTSERGIDHAWRIRRADKLNKIKM